MQHRLYDAPVEKSHYCCKAGGTCTMTKLTRSKCQKCRFETCLKAGMRPQCVLQPEEKQVRFRKKIKKEEATAAMRRNSSMRPMGPPPPPPPPPSSHVNPFRYDVMRPPCPSSWTGQSSTYAAWSLSSPTLTGATRIVIYVGINRLPE